MKKGCILANGTKAYMLPPIHLAAMRAGFCRGSGMRQNNSPANGFKNGTSGMRQPYPTCRKRLKKSLWNFSRNQIPQHVHSAGELLFRYKTYFDRKPSAFNTSIFEK